MNKLGIKINFKHTLITGSILAIMYAAFIVLCRIAPFGDRTFLMFDMKRQYVDYYAYLRSVIKGDNNILYSFSTTLGSGTLGFFAYYLSSPFLLLLCLFPQAYVPAGITLIIGIKLIIAGMIMDGFLQYYLRRNSGIVIFIGAISWGFSSFLISQSMNMMWTDVIILFPLFIWSLDRLIDTGRYWAYLVILSVMLLLNYYICYQVLIFAALWTIVRVIERQERNFGKTIGKVALYTILAPCICAAVLLPTALELANSPKDITQLGLETQGKNLSIIDVLSKIPSWSYDEIEPRFGFPQIFCGVIFIFLICLFFTSKKISIRKRLCMLGLLGIYMLSFCSDYVNLFMHAGMEPSGHPYRQAFMWIFLVIICGCEALNNIDNQKEILVGISGAISLVCIKLALNTSYDHISEMTIRVNAILVMTYVVLIVLVMCAYRFKKLAVINVLLVMIMLVNILDMFGNAFYTYDWESKHCNSYVEYVGGVKNTKPVVDSIMEMDDSFFRMENITPRQQNDGMQYVYNGVTHYSSAGLTYVRYLLQRMGYNDDSLYTHYGHDNTVAADMILGIKYLLSDGSVATHPDYECINESGIGAKELGMNINDGGRYVYLNRYALSPAIMVTDYELDGIGMDIERLSSDNWYECLPADNPFALQEDILSRIAGREVNLFTEAQTLVNEYVEDGGNVNREYIITPAIDGELYMYLNNIYGMSQGMSVMLNGEFVSTYGNEAALKILNLGYYNAGESVNVTIYGGSPEPCFGTEFFVSEDINAISKVYEDISKQNVAIRKLSSSHLQMNTPAGNGIFMTIPCEKGWHIKVDGETIIPTSVYGAFTYVEIPEGDNADESHIVEMRFVPEGLVLGAIVSCIAILGIILFSTFRTKLKLDIWAKRLGQINKTNLIKLGFVLGIIVLFIGVLERESKGRDYENELLYARIDKQKINVFVQDGEKYIFLPSYATEDKVDYSYSLKKTMQQEKVNVLKSANISTIYIQTASGTLDGIYANKDYSETGKITCINPNGTTDYSGALSSIQGHGNYSWNSEVWTKKPFGIKLDKTGRLFELGNCKNYTLIANASDPTLMRNDIAREMEAALEVPFSHKGVMADLYINGDYLGVYYLCDNLDISEEQIDITNLEEAMKVLYSGVNVRNLPINETVEYKGRDYPEEPDDITGGYLVEREFCDRYRVEYPNLTSGFMIDSGEDFIVKSPTYCSVGEITYIRSIFNDIDLALGAEDGYSEVSGKRYSELIDVDSFAKRYLVDEVSKNYDAGNSSAFFYKDIDANGGLVNYGPGWDYDMTFGSYQDWMDYEDPSEITFGQCGEESNQWYRKLYNRPDFEELVKKHYSEDILPYINSLLTKEIDTKREFMSAAYEMEAIRWKSMYEECGIMVGSDEAFDVLKSFVTIRSEALSKEWCE